MLGSLGVSAERLPTVQRAVGRTAVATAVETAAVGQAVATEECRAVEASGAAERAAARESTTGAVRVAVEPRAVAMEAPPVAVMATARELVEVMA